MEFPSQVVVYSADNISSQFDGLKTQFSLKRGGLNIPADQLSANSVVILLGGAKQIPGINYTVSENQLTFATPPAAGLTCNIRIITSEDSEQTLIVVPLKLDSPTSFNGSAFQFKLKSADTSINLKYLKIDSNNTFVFVGGVEQIPNKEGVSNAYVLDRIDDETVQVTFTEAPAEGLSCDIFAVCTANYWASRSIYPVEVYCLNTVSGYFNGAQQIFDLTYGSGNLPVNPATINTQNVFVAVGGSMQLPGIDYIISGSTIIFTTPPAAGLTCNIRVVTNAEFLTCPQSNMYSGSFMNWGPSIVMQIAAKLGLS